VQPIVSLRFKLNTDQVVLPLQLLPDCESISKSNTRLSWSPEVGFEEWLKGGSRNKALECLP
jgi:hypothetical protein